MLFILPGLSKLSPYLNKSYVNSNCAESIFNVWPKSVVKRHYRKPVHSEINGCRFFKFSHSSPTCLASSLGSLRFQELNEDGNWATHLRCMAQLEKHNKKEDPSRALCRHISLLFPFTTSQPPVLPYRFKSRKTFLPVFSVTSPVPPPSCISTCISPTLRYIPISLNTFPPQYSVSNVYLFSPTIQPS